MTRQAEVWSYMNDHRIASPKGMIDRVAEIVKAAFIAGCSKEKLSRTTAGVEPAAPKQAVRLAIDEWRWLEPRRKGVIAELNRSFEPTLIL